MNFGAPSGFLKSHTKRQRIGERQSRQRAEKEGKLIVYAGSFSLFLGGSFHLENMVSSGMMAPSCLLL